MSQASGPWVKSSASGTGNCVEWRFSGTGVLVRDSKNPDGPELTFTAAEWRAFLTGVRLGEADLPEASPAELMLPAV